MSVFDDDILKRAGDFRLEPREPVWDRIEQELGTKKRRRPIFWLWWLIPIGLAGGGVVYFTQSTPGDNAKVQSKTEAVKTPSTQNENQKNPLSGQTYVNEKNFLPGTQHSLTTTKSNASTSKATPSKGSLTEGLDEKDVQSGRLEQESVSQKETKNAKEKNSLQSGETGFEIIETEELTRSERGILSCIVAEKSTAIPPEAPLAIQVDKYSQPVPATSEYDSVPVKIEQSTLKKVRWNLVSGAGMHHVSSRGLMETNKSADFAYIPPLNNTSGGLGNLNNRIQPSEPGPGLVLGIQRTQTLGTKNRWEWVAGLHYQFQTIKISTGPRRDSVINIGDRNNRASYYNQGGSSLEKTGHQHRIHLLTGAKLFIGKQRKWAWQNSVFGGVVLANDYLIPLSSQTAWVPSKGLTKNGYFGVETGVQFQPKRWGAGLFGQYNLTSSVTDTRLTDQYWSSLELRIIYQLFSK